MVEPDNIRLGRTSGQLTGIRERAQKLMPGNREHRHVIDAIIDVDQSAFAPNFRSLNQQNDSLCHKRPLPYVFEHSVTRLSNSSTGAA